jgi:hypothetical protein
MAGAVTLTGVMVAVFSFFMIDNYLPGGTLLDNIMRGSITLYRGELSSCLPNFQTGEQPFCSLEVPYRFLLVAGALMVCLGFCLRPRPAGQNPN